jgi:hypothetical protein
MYYLHVLIDNLQKTKKEVFYTLVKDTELRDIADKYLEAQTKFAKSAIDTGWDLVENSWKKATGPFSKEYFPEAPYKVEPKESKQ